MVQSVRCRWLAAMVIELMPARSTLAGTLAPTSVTSSGERKRSAITSIPLIETRSREASGATMIAFW